MKKTGHLALIIGMLLATQALQSQATATVDSARSAAIERQMTAISSLLVATQRQLEQSQKELSDLRAELDAMKQPAASPIQPSPTAGGSSSSIAEAIAQQAEQQQVVQAEIKQHEQTKLESESKYPVKIYGLVLFNAFSNAGVVDNPDLPTVAFPRQPGTSHGSVGASLRQTVFGIRAQGPRLWGARTAADASVDFFGGLSYNFYGSATGDLRLRTADVSLGWARDEVHLGVDSPLISPFLLRPMRRSVCPRSAGRETCGPGPLSCVTRTALTSPIATASHWKQVCLTPLSLAFRKRARIAS